MLTKLELQNFKSWRSLDIRLSPLTILFGTNSSGKTSILDALLLLKQTAASFDRRQPINYGGGERDYIDAGSYRDLVFGHRTDQQINVQLEWQLQETPRFFVEDAARNTAACDRIAYLVRWRQLENRQVIERLTYKVLPETLDLYFRMDRRKDDKYEYKAPPGLKDTPGRPPYLPPPESCYAIPREIASWYSDFDPLEFNRQFEALMNRLVYLGPLRRYPKRTYQWTGTAPQEIGPSGENAIEALIASERRRGASKGNGKGRRKREPVLLEQVSEGLIRLGMVSEIQMQAIDEAQRFYQPQVRIGSEPVESSLVDVGFGVSQVLPVVALLFFAPEGSIVLIEQPEIHLHPSAQSELADLFLRVAEARRLQLIVESHSEHLLRRLQRRIAEASSEYATPEHIKAYFCELGPEGSEGSIAHPVETDMFGHIRNWPPNFFGDLAGDLDAMMDAGLARRRQELTGG